MNYDGSATTAAAAWMLGQMQQNAWPGQIMRTTSYSVDAHYGTIIGRAKNNWLK